MHGIISFIYLIQTASLSYKILGLDSHSAGSLSPGPAGAAGPPLLPPPAGRRCGSFSPRDSDARLSTSPAGSSGYGLRPHPPTGIMILMTAALQLCRKNISRLPTGLIFKVVSG